MKAVNGWTGKKAVKMHIRNIFSSDAGFMSGMKIPPKKRSKQAMNKVARLARLLQREFFSRNYIVV